MTTMDRVMEHYQDALKRFPKNRIVGCFLQGSQNYGLETPSSDVDTKLIVVPSFDDLAFNRQPISTTFIRENNEHTDDKDVRSYISCFRKQNLNFLEILFTEYYVLNERYRYEWMRLVEHREEIAHYDYLRAVTSMRGIAMNKFVALKKDLPSTHDDIQKYGYCLKQLHHLVRIDEYLERYLQGESYEKCLRPHDPEYLISLKTEPRDLRTAEIIAQVAMDHIDNMYAAVKATHDFNPNKEVDKLLNDVQYNIMKIAISEELSK